MIINHIIINYYYDTDRYRYIIHTEYRYGYIFKDIYKNIFPISK